MTARGIAMIDEIQGPPRWHGPDVLLRQTSFRALAEPRRVPRRTTARCRAGALRVRFGEVEERGIALTPQGGQLYDAAMATPDPAAGGREHFPATDAEHGLFRAGLLPRRRSVETGCLRGLPARSAAGIFRSNLDTGRGRERADNADYSAMAGRSDRAPHSRSVRTLRESRHHHDHRSDIPAPDPAADLRTQAARRAAGCRRACRAR